ncbi:hypothetical protein ACIQ2D_06320 [Lysinibacillus sp. NPDC097287]|uniref:hypothetical protein n=1 Tax=Lysinibacillus sp. NPDC097287 TaxID=3364144 RepID=UPI0038031C4B
MINTEWFSIRALTLPATAIALLLAFFIVWFILRMQFSKQWAGLYGDAIFTFIIVWKFSLIVTDFSSVIEQPIGLIYFNGGTTGVYLGVIAVLVQFVWKKQKIQLDEEGVTAGIWAILLTQSIYQWFVVLLNDNPVKSEVVTLIVLSILTIFILWKKTAIKTVLLIYTLVLMIVAVFQPQGLWQTAVGVSMLLFVLGYIMIQQVEGRK